MARSNQSCAVRRQNRPVAVDRSRRQCSDLPAAVYSWFEFRFRVLFFASFFVGTGTNGGVWRNKNVAGRCEIERSGRFGREAAERRMWI